jgi:hypothetical protein
VRVSACRDRWGLTVGKRAVHRIGCAQVVLPLRRHPANPHEARNTFQLLWQFPPAAAGGRQRIGVLDKSAAAFAVR